MLNKLYGRRLCVLMLGLGVMTANGAWVAAQDDKAEPGKQETRAPEPKTTGPEFRVRTHPADTFKPSEAISEDFPVAFPVDI